MRKLLLSQEITETVELNPEKWNYVSLIALNHQERHFQNANQEMNQVTKKGLKLCVLCETLGVLCG